MFIYKLSLNFAAIWNKNFFFFLNFIFVLLISGQNETRHEIRVTNFRSFSSDSVLLGAVRPARLKMDFASDSNERKHC